MTQAADIRSQFNAGEFSPLMEGRVDFAKYGNACRTMENFIPTVQGPAKRRPGSRFVAHTKGDQHVWLRPFVASATEQYVLEFGDLYIRFYTNHGQLQSSPGVAYEVVTPYAAADLTTSDGVCALAFAQSNDVLYIVHPLYPPATLSRTGVGTFAFAQKAVGSGMTGPFKDLNSDQTITISANGDGTTAATDATLTAPGITLSASSAIFTTAMVGQYFYVQEGVNVLVHQWEPGKDVLVADRRRSDGKNYVAVTAGKTGSVKIVHTEGKRWDGDSGVQWLYTDDSAGAVLITSLTSGSPSTGCNATVVSRLPYSVTQSPGGSTHRYATAAWSAADGYPSCIAFFRERLCFARNQTIWTSVAADFLNFDQRDGGQVLADSAITMTLGADRKDPILWLQSDRSLLAGTNSGEWAIAEYTNGQPFGPSNVKAERQSQYGSRQLKPLAIGSANLFLQRGGRVVQEMAYDIRQEAYQSSDISAVSEHITRSDGLTLGLHPQFDGILDWTFALRKDRIVWCARGDGQLIGLTYNREQEVVAWHRHKVGNNINAMGTGYATVETVCAVASPDGTYDELWIVSLRGSVRHIEWIGQPLETDISCTPWSGNQIVGHPRLVGLTSRQFAYPGLWELNAFFVDGGLSRFPTISYGITYPPDWAQTITGLDHLNNMTVQVLADGAEHPDCLVIAGSITLQYPAFTVHVGLKAPAILETTQLNSGSQDGTAQGKIKRITKVTARLFESGVFQIGPDATHLQTVEFRSADDKMDSYVPFFTGDIRIDWPGDYERDSRMYVYQDRPLPVTVVALMPIVVTRSA